MNTKTPRFVIHLLLCAVFFPLLFAQAPPGADYILSLRRVYLSNQETQGDTVTCPTVFPDKSFRFEKNLQFTSDFSTADFWVYKGTITDDQMQKLNDLLHDPNLIASERKNNDPVPGGTSMAEGEEISAFYVRDGQVREIQYMEAFGVPRQIMNQTNSINTTQPFYVPMKNPFGSLLKWQKDVAEKHKGKSLKGEPAY
jgi:hypothetical protein